MALASVGPIISVLAAAVFVSIKPKLKMLFYRIIGKPMLQNLDNTVAEPGSVELSSATPVPLEDTATVNASPVVTQSI